MTGTACPAARTLRGAGIDVADAPSRDPAGARARRRDRAGGSPRPAGRRRGRAGHLLRARTPMLPMRLFRSRSFSAGNTAIFFLWACALGAVFFMAQFLQDGLHYGPLAAGLRLMPWGATTVVVPQLAGRLITRLGERPFLVAGMGLQAAGMTWIALIAGPHLAYWHLVAPLAISGAGAAMAIPAAQSSVMGSVTPQNMGTASGAFNTMRQLGGACGVAVLVAVFGRAGSYASAQAFTDGFTPAIGASAALSLTGAIVGLAAPGRRSDASRMPAQAAPPVQAGAGSQEDLNQSHAQENRASGNALVTEPTVRKGR